MRKISHIADTWDGVLTSCTERKRCEEVLAAPLTARVKALKEPTQEIKRRYTPSSPFPSPSLIYELNLGDCFPQDTHTHTHCHKAMLSFMSR